MPSAGTQTPRPLPPWLGLIPLGATLPLLALSGGLGRSWIVLAAGVSHVVVLELIALWTSRRGERGTPLEAIPAAGVHLVRLVELALALTTSLLAMVVGWSWPVRPGWLIALILGLAAVALGLGLRRMSAALDAVRAAGLGERVKGYGPVLYRNPDDPRLWVPKLFSPGVTLNFARPGAWAILLGLLALPLAAVALILLTTTRPTP